MMGNRLCLAARAAAVAIVVAAMPASAQPVICPVRDLPNYQIVKQKFAEFEQAPYIAQPAKHAARTRFQPIRADAEGLIAGNHRLCVEYAGLVRQYPAMERDRAYFNAEKPKVEAAIQTFNAQCANRQMDTQSAQWAYCQRRRAEIAAWHDRVKAVENRIRPYYARIQPLPGQVASLRVNVENRSRYFAAELAKQLAGPAQLVKTLDEIIARRPPRSSIAERPPLPASPVRRLPPASCLALVAAGLAKNGGQLFLRPEAGADNFERASQVLQSMWDGARNYEGASCTFNGLDPDEIAKVRANLPRLKAWLGVLRQKSEKEAAEAEKRASEAAADAKQAGENRKAVDVLQQEARRAVAACGFAGCAQHPEVQKRIAVLDADAEHWNKTVIDRERERVRATEVAAEKKKETAAIGALESEVGRAIE